MIAIFTVLGLVLFGGGAYAIFDGWPYLVLERGFTQVIIGSIASMAGLILLSLAWVLKELKGVRESLLEASEARLATPAPAPAPVPEPAVVSAPAEVRMPPAPPMPSLAPAAVSVAAAGAVAEALYAPGWEEAPAAPKPAAATDFDLFGDLVARRLRDPAPEPEDPQAGTLAAEGPSLPDMFAGGLSERPAEPHEAEEPPVAVATESHEPAEIVSAKVQPIGEDEALAHSDDFAHFGHMPPAGQEPPAEQPAEPDEPAPAEEPAPEPEDQVADDVAAGTGAPPAEAFGRTAPSGNLDDFSALRESLTGHLRQSSQESERFAPAPVPAPVPPPETEGDPFAVAESWMDRASPRKEPWFEAPPPANEPEPAETAPPLWPPRTETPHFEEPPEAGETEAAAAPEEVTGPHVDEPAEEAEVPEPNVDMAEEPATPPEPAASEEGVVGAYQVGDAHFTIFADGSIRARTPDGEYSFASMDELKVYLASEKSRLGV